MEKLSVIIPSREEPFLIKTIQDLLNKSRGDIEIIATLDGWEPQEVKREFWMTPAKIVDPRVMYIAEPHSKGMRASINTAAKYATGFIKFSMLC